MTQPLLSILIPITPDRLEVVKELVKAIDHESIIHEIDILKQKYSHDVTAVLSGLHTYQSGISTEIVFMCDNRTMTLGEKRERLYEIAKGKYSWQIDSDDMVSDNAINSILIAIDMDDEDVDCITFQEKCLMNGSQYRSNFSLSYDDWHDNYDGYDFVRTPFYKCVIKTEIAKSVPFEHIRYGEDHAFARALLPHLKTEVHIDEELYIYQHNSKLEDFNTRYGFDRS